MELYYSLREASTQTGVKVRTLRDWIGKGKIKAVRFEGTRYWMISAKEVDRLKKK